MREIWLRVMAAALLSLTGIYATYTWSALHRVSVLPSSPEPMARLSFVSNEVQRRPAQRLIWQSVLRNQDLYPGEAVRTASGSEAKIEFLGQGTVVQLEPETVIEIEKGVDGINLDFLKGNLFIRSTGQGSAPSGKITLKSGDQAIKIADAEVAVSKPSTSMPLDVDVVKGKVQLLKNGQVDTGTDKNKLKVIHPLFNEVLYVRPEGGAQASFEWEKVDSSYQVSLEMGPSRSRLKKVEGVEVVSGAKGQAHFPVTLGKTYFRLTARSSRPTLPPLASSVFRADLRAKLPPQLLEPVRNGVVSVSPENKQVLFRWANPGRLTDVVIEVARSADLTKFLYTKNLGRETEHLVEVSGENGPVYWRVSGRLPGASEMVSSPIEHFVLHRQEAGAPPIEPLLAPVLKTPLDATSLSLLSVNQQGVKLTWSPVQGASSYTLTFAEGAAGKSYTREIKGLELNVRNLAPGEYKWSVVAKDDFGQVSPSSQSRAFVVEGASVLAWADSKTEEKILYRTLKPLVRLAWRKPQGPVVSYRVRLRGAREPATLAGWEATTGLALDKPLEVPGSYLAEVEALDANGIVLARTEPRQIEVAPAPLLPPPNFEGDPAATIQASDQGEADISWASIDGARDYLLSLRTKDGESVQSFKKPETRAHLTDLKPGEYQVVVQAIDTAGRLGTESAARPLRVPEYSGVRAPKLKSVNVK